MSQMEGIFFFKRKTAYEMDTWLSTINYQLSRLRRLLRALWPCTFRQRRGFGSRLGQSAVKLLPPVRHIAGRTVAVDHPQRRLADVGKLMKHARRDVNCLATVDGL